MAATRKPMNIFCLDCKEWERSYNRWSDNIDIFLHTASASPIINVVGNVSQAPDCLTSFLHEPLTWRRSDVPTVLLQQSQRYVWMWSMRKLDCEAAWETSSQLFLHNGLEGWRLHWPFSKVLDFQLVPEM